MGLANVTAEVGDAERLELPEGSFDGAYARWVMFVVGDADAVAEGVARALRPGGTFVAQEYCSYEGVYVSPRAPVFARVFGAVAESIRASGGDPDVGSRLPELMRRHGVEPRSVRPLQRVARPGTALWEWPRGFFENFLPTLVAEGRIGPGDAEEFMDEWHWRTLDPDAFFWTPPMVEVVGVKG